MGSRPQATVREVNGQAVIDDPQGLAVLGAIERHNLYRADPDATERLEARAREKTEQTNKPFGVIMIDVDVPDFADMAEALMPDHDWDSYRGRGEKPVARGCVPRELLVEMVNAVREDARVGADPMPERFTAVFGLGGVTLFEVKESGLRALR